MATFLYQLEDHRDIVARLRIAGFHISMVLGDELRVLRLLDLLKEKRAPNRDPRRASELAFSSAVYAD